MYLKEEEYMEKAYKLVTAQEVVTIAFTSVEAMMSGSKPAIKAPITITIVPEMLGETGFVVKISKNKI